jgi:hypothetical protein
MISLKDLKLDNVEAFRSTVEHAIPRPEGSEPFLTGPIPMAWLAKAATVPGAGKALAVAIVIWFIVGVERRASVKLRPSVMRSFGIDRFAGYRALKAMQSAGLIKFSGKPGQAATVTLLPCRTQAPPARSSK